MATCTYKMGQAADLLGVSVDTVRRWADAGRLTTARTASGHRMVDGAALAALAASLGARHRAAGIPSESARNHFLGLITEVITDGVMAQVKIQAGRYRVVSLISREAAVELCLEPGMLAIASVKATNVVIELPVPS